MALTLETSLRDAMANIIDDTVNIGSGTSNMQLETSGDVEVATFDFQNPAFGAASTGVITLLGTTLTDAAATGGLVAQYSIYDRDAAKVLEGVVAVSGADLDLTSLNVGVGDTVELTSFSIEVPA
jgi:hypothetical protein